MGRIVYFAFVAWLLVQCAPVLAQGLITEEAAEQAVREFENDLALQVACVKLAEDASGPTWCHRSWYTVRHADYPMVHRVWTVDAHTAKVDHASYGDLGPLSPYEEPSPPLTKEAYRPVAEAFARAKYEGFDTLGLVLTMERWVGIGWLYAWQQKVAYDALSPNMVAVVVAPESGYILQYDSIRVATPTPRPPQVTSAQALDIAEQAAGIATADEVEGPVLVTDPDGGVVWHVTVGGQSADDSLVNCDVAVDAETGNVLAVSQARLPSRRDYRGPVTKLTRDHAENDSGRQLILRDVLVEHGYRIHWDQARRRVVARHGHDTVLVEVGSKVAAINGRQLHLAQAPYLQDGRVRIPRGFTRFLP